MIDHRLLPPDRLPLLEVYVDGTNFHLALRYSGGPTRVDLNLLARHLGQGYRLVKLRYYTAPHPDPKSEAFRRQQRMFAELRRSSRIELVLGRHEARRVGRSGRLRYVEKETDVNLAVDLVVGAYEARYDVTMLVAGDSDYVRAVRAVRALGKHVVWCPLPRQRHVHHLGRLSDEIRVLDADFLRRCALGR